MRLALTAATLLLSAALSSQSFARDFGYEKFEDAVRAVYGADYGTMVPFDDITSPTDDPTRRGEGYPGQIMNLAAAQGRNGGVVYTNADVYCTPPVSPAPIVVGTTQLKNWLYRTEIGLNGDFTVTGATPSDVIFSSPRSTRNMSIPLASRSSTSNATIFPATILSTPPRAPPPHAARISPTA